MSNKLKKIFVLVSGAIASCGTIYAADNNSVVSQGGPLGSTSIGDQNLNPTGQQPTDSQITSSSSPSNTAANQNVDQTQLLLELQKQVQKLQGELNKMKTTDSSSNSGSFSTYSSKVTSSSGSPSSISQALAGNNQSDDVLENIGADNSIVNLSDANLSNVFNKKGGIDVGGAPAITTGGQLTYLGAYTGNNSVPIGQISSNLFASTLLGQRGKFDDYSIFFGGLIEADAQAWGGNFGDKANGASGTSGQNIYLTNAKLYFLSNLGHYVTAQFDFDTNENGDFSLGNAFAIFGNIDTSPFFVTAGRNKISVGAYGGGNIYTGGLNGFLAPSSVTNVSLNYKTDTINTNIAVFGADDKRADFSLGFFYSDNLSEDVQAAFNVGYVYDIAGAGNGSIKDFQTTGPGNTGQTIGSFNVDALLSYAAFGGTITGQTGWTTATSSADFNGNGGNVIAGTYYVGGAYQKVLFGRNTSFQTAFAQTYNAAAIEMAAAQSTLNYGNLDRGIEYQYTIGAQRSYFDDNVLIGPEYAYQRTYTDQNMSTVTLNLLVYI